MKVTDWFFTIIEGPGNFSTKRFDDCCLNFNNLYSGFFFSLIVRIRQGYIVKKIVLLMLAFILLGCTTFYYGHTREEWDMLSESGKEKARDEYKDVIAEKEIFVRGDSRQKTSEAFIDRAVGETGN